MNKILTYGNQGHKNLVALLCCIISFSLAHAIGDLPQQEVTVQGTVLDENGLPLLGVNVVEQNTTNGVSTDFDGNFSINVTDENAILMFTYIGFEEKEIAVGNLISSGSLSNIEVNLVPSSSQLTEVVVVGYGQESKATQTSAVTSLKAEEIANIPVTQLSTSLAGRMPGAQILQNSGFVGSNSSISVRGASVSALYVIDNVLSDKSQFDALNPNEVASISILKDAAAAAIYGARAAGGVVVVKTKTGTSGKVRVNYRSIVTTSMPIRPLQDWTPHEELIYRNQLAYNRNRASDSPDPNFAPPFDDEALEYSRTLNYETLNDIIFSNPLALQHNLDVSGGNEKTRYFFSGGYNNNQGSYKRTSFDKYSMRAKVDSKIGKYVDIGANISYNRQFTSRFYWPYGGDGEGFTVGDFYRPSFNLSRLYPFYMTADGQPTTYGDPNAISVVPPDWHFNPAQTVLSDNYRHINENTFNAIFNVTVQIPWVKGLSLDLTGNYRQDNGFRKNFIGQFNVNQKVQTESNSGIGLLKLRPLLFDVDNTSIDYYARSFTGIDEQLSFQERYQANAFLNYKRSFGTEHYIDAFVAVEQYKFSGKYVSGTASDALSPDNDQIIATNSATERRYFNGGELDQARLSYFGRAKYINAGKYILEGSFRADGSYIFPAGKRFGFFPSISAGWVMSKEDFFDVSEISNLKLRFSYGTTGYDGFLGTETNIAPYQYQYNFVPQNSYTFENSTLAGLGPQSRAPNPDITWAVNKTFNYGLDAGLFDDRLAFTFDYFTTNKSNILTSLASSVPGTFGSALPEQNIGEQKAHGFESAIDYFGNIGNDFTYSIGANVAYVIDEYVKWPQAEGIPDFQNVIGRPTAGVFVGYVSQGIVKDQAVVDDLNAQNFTQFGRNVVLGNVLLEDIRGDNFSEGPDGKIDANDRTIIATNAIPRLTFGAPLNFKWKGLALDLFFQGVGMYDKFPTTINTRGAGGVFQFGTRPYFELWTDAYSPEYNPDGQYPAVFQGWVNPDQSGSSTTFWKRNGAFVRLKNVNLSYTLPSEISSKLGMAALSMNANATNVFLITGFKEYDPDQDTLDSFPILKSYSLGLNLSF